VERRGVWIRKLDVEDLIGLLLVFFFWVAGGESKRPIYTVYEVQLADALLT
jgi:hypothetical protein